MDNYRYDAEGNLIKKYPTSGSGATTKYEWDHRNRIVRVLTLPTKNSPDSASTQIVSYFYDSMNQLVSRLVDADGAAATGTAPTHIVYYYDQGQIVMDVDTALANGSQTTGSPTFGEVNRYLWGTAVDQLLSEERDPAGTVSKLVFWPMADHLGTIRDWANDAGVVEKRICTGAAIFAA